MSGPYTSPLAAELAGDLLERFVRYCRVGTQAGAAWDPDVAGPSSPGQLVLGRMLVAELRELGLSDAAIDLNGYVTATVPATVPDAPVIGLLAHLDTSPDAPGEGVEPIVHRDYDGRVIRLPEGGTVLDPAHVAHLAGKAGHDIVTSSGDTLLGADDKAGVAEIMSAVAWLLAHPDWPRPTLRIGFTVDEEIGHGADRFDVAAFGAACAYTMDGSTPGEVQDETFTAAAIRITVTGVDIHPGFAKGVMVNAARLAARIVAELPADRLTPETTDGRDGFLHVHDMSGDATTMRIGIIARDFDDDRLEDHIALVRDTAERAAAWTPGAGVRIDVTYQYPNMRRRLDAVPDVAEAALAAVAAEGITPRRTSIRGGTDGSRLTEMGLPTPNIFTGGHEFHSVREWASLQDMAAAAAVIVRLAEVWASGRYTAPS